MKARKNRRSHVIVCFVKCHVTMGRRVVRWYVYEEALIMMEGEGREFTIYRRKSCGGIHMEAGVC